MPHDHGHGHFAAPGPDSEIYRQIVVTTDPETFASLEQDLSKILEGIEYTRLGHIPELGLLAVEVARLENVGVALQRFRSREVLAAEPNRPVRLTGVVIPPVPAVDDPLYWDQWGSRQIVAEPAWQRAKDAAQSVTVAIIDTGVSTKHPDLVGHLWDDGGGHHGWNVVTGTDDVEDTDGHGTLLAGTIGAMSNNSIGIAAAEWPIKLMPVVFHDVRTPVNAWSGILAIWWAAAHGAKVINLAWDLGLPLFWLRQALWLLGRPPWRVLFVAGAGNDGLDNDVLPTYPASYGGNVAPDNLPNVMSVMASDEYDDRPGFSNYGRNTVHLAAPGIRILSTQSYFTAARWRHYSGTSAACAQVANAAAMLKGLNAAWTPSQIRQHLIDSADRQPVLRCQAEGRLNLERAVCGPLLITAPQAGDVWQAGANVQVRWDSRYSTALCTSVRVLLGQQGSPTFSVLATGRPNNGACTVTLPGTSIPNARLRLQSEQAPAAAPGLYADSAIFRIEI